MERAQNFRARAELELSVSSPDEPELVKIPLEPASSMRFLLIKNTKSNLHPSLSLSEISDLSSLKPGAHLLRAKNSAQAFKPEPRLVPPLEEVV